MLTVGCVWVGNKYGPEYPVILEAMVKRHLSVDHKFEVLIDDESWADPCWNKVRFFDRKIYPGPMLILDLDIVICASIDHLVPNERFRAMRDPRQHAATDLPKLNSSVLSFCPGPMSEQVFAHWNPARDCSIFRGDQEYIEREVFGNWDPAEGVHSYRAGIKRDTCISVLHGQPKPHQAAERDPFVSHNWRV